MLKKYLSMVKFAHTIFAMPFALTGFVLATQQDGVKFEWLKLALVVGCMVFARNAAMGFNRFIDRRYDAQNVRTAVREIPSGAISPSNAMAFVVVNCLLFIAATWFINLPCFILSPVALAVVLGYSYTKRFTALCHLVLGLGLSLAPVGAYLAVTGEFALAPILLGCVVLTWVSGFDIIYALQDEEFDRGQKLHSIPAWLGRKRALRVSELLHLASAGLMVWFVARQEGHWLAWVAAAIFIGLLVYQHLLVKPNDLSRVNLAFFTTNGIASVIFATLVILDLLFL